MGAGRSGGRAVGGGLESHPRALGAPAPDVQLAACQGAARRLRARCRMCASTRLTRSLRVAERGVEIVVLLVDQNRSLFQSLQHRANSSSLLRPGTLSRRRELQEQKGARRVILTDLPTPHPKGLPSPPGPPSCSLSDGQASAAEPAFPSYTSSTAASPPSRLLCLIPLTPRVAIPCPTPRADSACWPFRDIRKER